MRRAVLALAGLAAGTTLLVVVKAGPDAPAAGKLAADGGPVTDRGPVTDSSIATGSGPDTPSAPAGTAASPSFAASSRPVAGPVATSRPAGRPATGRPRTSEAATRPTSRPTKTPKPTPPGPYRVTGSYVQNPYGAVQVQLVVDGDRFTDVVALVLPDREARSQTISKNAVPQLRAEALREQSADLDTVSGATATSESYVASLQAAIDRATKGERD